MGLSKTTGKNHKVFLRKPKQIHVKLHPTLIHGNKWKRFLASWSTRILEYASRASSWMLRWKENLGAASKYCIILVYIYMMGGGYIESIISYCAIPFVGERTLTLKSASELQRLFEINGIFYIVKSTLLLSLHSTTVVMWQCDAS